MDTPITKIIAIARRLRFASTSLSQRKNFQKKKIRVLGLVEKGTVHWSAKDTTLEFFITENGKDKLRVFYTGIKPDLFREGQGAVVEGVMQGENFAAATLLVKHSEEYRVENHDQKNLII